MLRQTGVQGGRKLRQQFLAFPGGRSGIGLVLLRLTLGMAGIAQGLACFLPDAGVESLSFGGILLTSGALVVIGLFTPYASMTVATVTACRSLSLLSLPPSIVQQSPFTAAILVVLGIAVALLGPGLFSLDFRMFGHREIVIPRRGAE